MRLTDPEKRRHAFLFLLLSLCFVVARAQTPTPVVPRAGQSAAAEEKDAGVKSSSEKNEASSAGNSSEDVNKPAIGGATKTVIVKDESEIPKRKNLDYEDWSTPVLTPGMKTEAVPLLKSEQNGFTRELISLQWRELDPIDVWVIKPTGMKNPPVILYLYSYPSDNVRYKDTQFCQFVTQRGFAAVGFVSAVTGQRRHDRPTKDTFVNQLQEALATSTHDVQMILNYLAKRGDLDMSRVGMWGDGSGAGVAIMAAAVDSRIKALDLLDPWGDWPEWLASSSLVRDTERADVMKPEFLKTVENLDPLKYLPQLKTQQVRLQYIKHGLTATPDAVQQKMEGAAPSTVNVVHYESMNAFLDDVASKGIGFDWIKERLESVVAASDRGPENVTKASEEDKSPSR